MASELSKNRSDVICAPISLYLRLRRSVREMIESQEEIFEIHLATSLEAGKCAAVEV